MKTEVPGDNEDGSKHVLYILEGFSATIIDELWTLYKIKRHYPMSIEINGAVIPMDSARDLRNFTFGMQVAFELCSL